MHCRHPGRRRIPGAACLPVALILVLLAAPTRAQDTETVSNLNDSGAGSLRQAVENQDDDGQNDLYFFTAPSGTITLLSDMEPNGDDGEIVDLNGRNITVTGGFRLFQDGGVGDAGGIEINDMAGAAAGTLTLQAAPISLFGTLRLSRGTLTFLSDDQLLPGMDLVIGSQGVLRANGTVQQFGALSGVAGGVLDVGTGVVVTNFNDGTDTFAGVISGTGQLQVIGTGTLTLSGSSTHTGEVLTTATLRIGGAGVATTVLSDSVSLDLFSNASGLDLNGNSERIGDIQGIAGSQVRLGAGTLTVGDDFAGTRVLDGVISGTGGLTKEGAAYEMQLGGASTYDGATTVNAGQLTILASERIDDDSDLVVEGAGTFSPNGFTETVASLSGTSATAVVALGAGTLVTNGDNTSTSYAGILSGGAGTGHLTKAGSGVLTLTGASTYEGVTAIDAGVLRIGGASERLDDDTDIVLSASGSFDLNGFTETIGSLASTSVNARVTLGTGTLVTNGDGSSTQFDGLITGAAGAGALTKRGAGVLTLTGTNTYEGVTSITAGSLRIAGASERLDDDSDVVISGSGTFDLNGFTETVGSLAGSSGTARVALGAGTLVTNGDGSSTQFEGVIGGGAGTGALVKNGAGILTLTGANTYEGVTTIDSGSLQIAGASERIDDDSDIVLTGSGTFDLNSLTETVGSLTGGTDTRVTLGTGTLVTGDGTSTQFDGVITGAIAGNLTKAGTGTLVLTGGNTYEGVTTVNAGTLRLAGGSERLDDDTDLVIAGSGTFDLNGFIETVASLSSTSANARVELGSGTLRTHGDGTSTEFAGRIGGSGNLTKLGGGVLTLSGPNTYTGLTRIDAGTLFLASGASLDGSSDLTLSAAGTRLDINGNSQQVGTLTGVDGSLVRLNGGTFSFGEATNSTFAGSFSSDTGIVIKLGAGTQTLSGASDHTGGTRMREGGLVVSSDTSLGRGSFTFEDTAADSSEALIAGAAVTLANPIAVLNEGINTLDTGVFGVNLTGVISGTQILERSGTGTLTLSNTGSAGFGGRIDNNSGVIRLAGGAVYGSLATLTGGLRNESAGTVQGSGTLGFLDNRGVLSPGSVPGERGLVRAGAFGQTATGDFRVDADPDGTSDRLDASTGAILAGTLTITGNPGQQASYFGRTYTVLRAGTSAGDDVLGAFGNLVDNLDDLAPRVIEVTDSDGALDLVQVVFDRLAAPLSALAVNPNQASAGTAAEQVFVAGQARDDFRQVFDQFFLLDPADPQDLAEIRSFLQDIAGESRVAALSASLAVNQLVTGRVIGQMDSITFEATHENGEDRPRTVWKPSIPPPPGRRVALAPPRAGIDGASHGAVIVGNGPARRGPPTPPEPEPNKQVWVLGAGTSGGVDETDITQGAELDGGGFTVGLSWKPEVNADGEFLWMWGAHAGYQGTEVQTPGDLDRTDVDSFNFGVHGRYDDDGRYANVVLGYVLTEFTTRRSIRLGIFDRVARGDYEGNEFFTYGEMGRVYPLDDEDADEGWHVQPQVALQYRSVHQDAYTETGAGDLSLTVAENGLDSLQSALGVRFFFTERTDEDGWIVPEVTVRWGHEFGEIERSLQSSFAGTSPVFRVEGPRADRDTLQIRAGMAAYTLEDWNLDVSYAGELGGTSRAHAGVVKVVCRFE